MDRPREADTEQAGDPRGAAFTAALAGLARGHKLTVTELSGTRFKVSAGPETRALEIEARPRSDDGGRWWFCWGGTVWLCEADNPTDALVQIKGALKRIVSPWSQPEDAGVSWVRS
ncbi:hypothetical protein AB0J52_20290 [Spirillospora sp. NPDC049652]